jgi:hypothetical protein
MVSWDKTAKLRKLQSNCMLGTTMRLRGSGSSLARTGLIAAPGQQARDRNILVYFVPMEAAGAKKKSPRCCGVACNRRGNETSGMPNVRPSSSSTHICASSKRTSIGLGEEVIPSVLDLGAAGFNDIP